MAIYNTGDRPQSASSVNVGQFGPSHDSLQDWRSVFTAANEVLSFKDSVEQTDAAMKALKVEAEQTLSRADASIIISEQVSEETQTYVRQAVTDVTNSEQRVQVMADQVSASETLVIEAGNRVVVAENQVDLALSEIKDIFNDVTHLTVTLLTPEAGTPASASFNNATNMLTLVIPKTQANFTGAGGLPVEAPNPSDTIVAVRQANTDSVYRFSIADLTNKLTTGTIIRGAWDPTTNTVTLDPQNTSIIKDTAPVVAEGQPTQGAGYTVITKGSFSLRGYTLSNFEVGDIIQWSDTAGNWIHQKIGSKITSVRGERSTTAKTGDVVLTLDDLGAYAKEGGILNGDLQFAEGKGIKDSLDNYVFQTRKSDKAQILGDVTYATVLEGKEVWMSKPTINPDTGVPGVIESGRIFSEIFKPTAKDVGVYSKTELYTQKEIDSKLSGLATTLATKIIGPRNPTNTNYVWNGRVSGWTALPYNGVPLGTVCSFYGKKAPTESGFLECNGQFILKTEYPDAFEHFKEQRNGKVKTTQKIGWTDTSKWYKGTSTGVETEITFYKTTEPMEDLVFKIATPTGSTSLIALLDPCDSSDGLKRVLVKMIKGKWSQFKAAVQDKSLDIYHSLVDIPTEDGVFLPALRGEFVRGWDHYKQEDSTRALGSHQKNNALLPKHNHDFKLVDDKSIPRHNTYVSLAKEGRGKRSNSIRNRVAVLTAPEHASSSNYVSYIGDGSSNGTALGVEYSEDKRKSIETRPNNVALMYIIKVRDESKKDDALEVKLEELRLEVERLTKQVARIKEH